MQGSGIGSTRNGGKARLKRYSAVISTLYNARSLG